MTGTKLSTFCRTLAIAVLAALPSCAQPSAQMSALVGGRDAYEFLLQLDTAPGGAAYRVDGMAGWASEETDPRERFHAYPIISGPVPIDATSAATLRDVLTSESTYLWETAKACEFLPGVALRWSSDDLQWDVLLCFSCDELEVYRDGKQVGHEDFDPRRADLVRVAKHLFPGDEAIRALRETD